MTMAHILIVDDDFLIAETLSAMVAATGCVVIGPAGTLDRAHVLLGSHTIHAALLDFNLGTVTSEPVANALVQRKVPIAFVTAYGRHQLPEQYRGNPYLQKPAHFADLQNVIRAMLPIVSR